MDTRARTIGVRVDPAFSAEIKAAADRHFQGNESHLIREAARVYIGLRGRLGLNFDIVILGSMLGEGLLAPPPAEKVPA